MSLCSVGSIVLLRHWDSPKSALFDVGLWVFTPHADREEGRYRRSVERGLSRGVDYCGGGGGCFSGEFNRGSQWEEQENIV